MPMTMTSPLPASRTMGGVAVAALLASVIVVNIAGVLPARVAGPLARLPKLKQSWQLLAEPSHSAQLLEMTATLADGSERVIASSAETNAAGPRELIWPSTDPRERKYWHCLWSIPVNMPIGGGSEAYYDIFRTHWDQAHPPAQHIVRFAVVWHAIEIPSIDLANRPNPAVAHQQLTIYAWPPASSQ